MQNWKHLCIEIVVLLLIHVSDIQSGCRWDDTTNKNCSIKCDSPWSPAIFEKITDIMKDLVKDYAEVGVDDVFR